MATAPLQIMIVGFQTTPTLIGGLDRTLQTQNIVLLHTSDHTSKAEQISTVYQKYKIQPHLFKIQSAFDPKQIQQDLEKLKSWLETQFPNQRPTFNFTIGTKLQAVLYTQFAQEKGWQINYIDNQDQLLWLSPADTPPQQLEDRITIEDALLANGYRITQKQPLPETPAYAQVTHKIIEQLNRFEKPLRQLNYLAFTSKKLSVALPANMSESMQALLQLFQKAGFIKIQGERLIFINEAARFFANGGWLEIYLANHIRQLSHKLPPLQDFALGLEVENLSTGVRNELDCVVLFNNALHIIECKTKYFKSGGNPEGAGVQALYKLDTLSGFIGGAFSKGLLATIFPLTPSDERRASQYRIEVIKGKQLQTLQPTLKAWLEA